MKQVVIENPVINSPYDEPTRHFRFTDEGIANEVIDGRRSSSYFVPITRPRKKGQKQLEFDTEWTQDRVEENKRINQIRARGKKLFFCQIEAFEIAVCTPDFIACIDDGHGADDLLSLLIEVTGEHKKDKAAKVSAARMLRVPAVNNHGGFGRWAFIEIDDPWNAENQIWEEVHR